jgi:hypothetical protein
LDRDLSNRALGNFDHSKTKAKSEQTNGICKRFHRTIVEEFYQLAFRKRRYASLDEMHPMLTI